MPTHKQSAPPAVSNKDSQHSSGFLDWVKKYLPPAAAAITVFAALIVGLHFYVSGDIRSLQTRVDDEVKRSDTLKTDTEKKLSEQEEEIKAARKAIDDELIKLLDKAYGTNGSNGAKNASLTGRLEETRDVLRIARSTRASLRPELVKRIGSELSQSQDRNAELPAYWQAASEVINYRSERQSGSPGNLPLCNFVHASIERIPLSGLLSRHSADGKDTPVFNNVIDIFHLANCRVDLSTDDLTPPPIKGGTNWQVTCDGCVVRYDGGALRTQSGVIFRRCIFVFDIRVRPQSLAIAELTKQLLVSKDFEKLDLKTS